MRTFALLLLVACKSEPEDTLVEACAAPPGDFVAGDAQGDGAADLSDAVAILRAAMDAEAAPGCLAAVDLIENGRVDADDGTSLLLALFEGAFALPTLARADCRDATPWAAGGCADLALSWEVAGREATLSLASSSPIEAWSLGVEAEGCAITDASVAGTVAADATADDDGLRDLGYNATLLRRGVVTQAVILGMADRVELPGDGAPHPILRVTTDGPCTLTVADGARTYGEPVRRVAVAAGRALALPEVVVEVP